MERKSMSEKSILPFGMNWGLVPGIKAAWGARAIIDQKGMVDLLPDRQGTGCLDEESVEHEALAEKTMAWLNDETKKVARTDLHKQETARPFVQARALASHMLKEYKMEWSSNQGFILYTDKQGAIIASPNGSYGYLYIAAYLYEALPDGHPTKGLEIVMTKDRNSV